MSTVSHDYSLYCVRSGEKLTSLPVEMARIKHMEVIMR